jgi:hypothetical protein
MEKTIALAVEQVRALVPESQEALLHQMRNELLSLKNESKWVRSLFWSEFIILRLRLLYNRKDLARNSRCWPRMCHGTWSPSTVWRNRWCVSLNEIWYVLVEFAAQLSSDSTHHALPWAQVGKLESAILCKENTGIQDLHAQVAKSALKQVEVCIFSFRCNSQ